jgi:dihydroxyacetone kinase-like predicted kinase
MVTLHLQDSPLTGADYRQLARICIFPIPDFFSSGDAMTITMQQAASLLEKLKSSEV